tara:strand:+ start:120 stop:326 length:207 start_codon:yes stop_codon:yes gene_type:complete
MLRSKTLGEICKQIIDVPKNISFNDFNMLILGGDQKLLTYGEYNKKQTNKNKRQKVIKYFYKKLRSKL